MMVSTAVPPGIVMAINSTKDLGLQLQDGTVLVSGWAQLAVCIVIVITCCCCTLLCLCTSCVCCTRNVPVTPCETLHPIAVITDKPPSYEEAERSCRGGLPSYQEALKQQPHLTFCNTELTCQLQSSSIVRTPEPQ